MVVVLTYHLVLDRIRYIAKSVLFNSSQIRVNVVEKLNYSPYLNKINHGRL
jgi:hypothetical protein